MTRALLVVDHGSRRDDANQVVVEVARRLKAQGLCPIVEPAHMELAEPTIAQAFDACVAQGAAEVIIHPYFLGPGRHTTSDIPALAAAAANRHPHVAYRVTEPLGVHPNILAVIRERTGL